MLAVLLALATFGLYGLTAERLVGYESETAAVAEGLVKIGQPRLINPSPLSLATGALGRAGLRYGRAGLTQPLLEAPVYWLGEKLDDSSSAGRTYRWRKLLLELFDPLMAAVTVAAIFLLLGLRGVSERRALLVSVLCAVGTLIWPYSKIGMDTTLMASFAVAMAAAAWVARRPTAGRWALLGLAVAVAINAKAYGALLLVGAIPLIAPSLLELSRARRVAALAALAAPVILGLALVGWYNWYRTGSVSDFADAYQTQRLLAMPFSALGLLVSPGKGLLLYSPLVLLGVLGLRELGSADRPLAQSIVLSVAINVAFIATSVAWTDETWGPRYLLPTAWLLVLPIAWWLTNHRRTRWLAALTAIAISVQFVAIFAIYGVDEKASGELAGQRVYAYTSVAYGDDGPRWVPQASPLLFQFELTLADIKERITGSGFVVTYAPWRGHTGVVDLRHPSRDFGPLPDFWWTASGLTTKQDGLALCLAFLLLGCGAALIGFGTRGAPPGLPLPRRATVSTAG